MPEETTKRVAARVAVAASLWGHDLHFDYLHKLDELNGRYWCVCVRCRLSCYLVLDSERKADASMERWMMRPCIDAREGARFPVDSEGYGPQLLPEANGLKVVFSREVLSRELIESRRRKPPLIKGR